MSLHEEHEALAHHFLKALPSPKNNNTKLTTTDGRTREAVQSDLRLSIKTIVEPVDPETENVSYDTAICKFKDRNKIDAEMVPRNLTGQQRDVRRNVLAYSSQNSTVKLC